MAQRVFSPDAWTRARDRFVEDLSDVEQRLFSQASPETILYDASAIEKTHQAQSTTRGIVAKLQPFVNAVEQYGSALDVYSNIYPLGMSPIWGSVRIVLHLAKETHKYFEKIADMFDRIGDLLPRLRLYEDLFSNHERLVHSISVLYFDILQFCSEAKIMFRRAKRTMLSLAWKPFERQFGSHIDAFRRHQEEMKENVSASHMIEASDSRALIRSNQVGLAKERSDKERIAVFASLSSAVDYEAKYRKLQELRYEGTGEWLVRHSTYTAWKESSTSKGVIIHGIPGSGKSVLTSLIIDDHLEDPTSPARNTLFFHCDYGNPPTLQPVHIYRALLQQLFFRGLMTEVTIKNVIETFRANVNGLNDHFLIDSICQTIGSCAGVSIVLDGLDECERDVQQAITNTIHRLLMENSLIKVLITCRDEGHLLTSLNDFDRLQISRNAPAADIQSYISHAIASNLSSGSLTIRNPNLKEEISSKLMNKAQGMFLWVHFQIAELCDAISDEGIREILDHLPEGLHETYTRIFKRISKTGSKAIVLKIMMWMVCARRPLSLEELQEAVAFDSGDRSWNADKIPNGDKMIKSCHGLVVRDTDVGKVRLAHHTVQQYLVSPQDLLPATSSEDFEDLTARSILWPEFDNFRRNIGNAEVMAGRLCATYLCFSDFSSAVSRKQDHHRVDLAAAFRDRGPVSIPAALGLGKHLRSLPYRFFGTQDLLKMPEIDYSKYLCVTPRNRSPHPEFRKKFAFLEYVIEYWPWHTREFPWSSEPKLEQKFWNLVQHETIAFEFRPWGSNRHFGPYGCKGCPITESGDLNPEELPSMALVHWAAETGHTKVFDIVEPPLQEYLKHERYHDETLLIACRHAQEAAVDTLLTRGAFDLSDGRAIIAACTFGSEFILRRLLRVHPNYQDAQGSWVLRLIGPRALYWAASNGHESIVEFFLERKVELHYGDTMTGLTSLQIAAQNGYLQVVKAICEKSPSDVSPGSDRDPPHKETGMKALHYAAANGHSEVVILLLEHNFRVDDRDSLGETALIKASRSGQAVVAKALLDWGADYIIRGGKLTMLEMEMEPGPMAIHHATFMGHDNITTILPLCEEICGSMAQNALHIGAMCGHLNVVQTLLFKGADIESKDGSDMRALHLTSHAGHTLVVQKLLDNGCEINARASLGRTALHLAARAARPEVIKLLVTSGADITTDERGITALHEAARHADAGTVRTLVELGAQLEAQTTHGETALDQAISCQNSANVSALIELGANWISFESFNEAFHQDNTEVDGILLNKASKATVKEKREAAEVIQQVLERNIKRRRKVTFLLFETWIRINREM